MGVLNVTPDSFSDGGRFDDPADAIAHGHAPGGRRGRPGRRRRGVHPARRRAGVGRRGASARAARSSRRSPATGIQVSIDTRKAEVARAAVAAGAQLVNDVGRVAGRGGRRPRRGLGRHARAGRPRHDAGRPPLRRRRGRGRGLPRGARRVGAGRRRARGVDRPGHRLRQDHRAQPGAAGPPRRAGGHRPPRGRGHEPQGASSAGCSPRPTASPERSTPTTGSRGRWPPPPGPSPSAWGWCGCTTCAPPATRCRSSPARSR